MKVIAILLAAIIIVTEINGYAANREKVAQLMDGMYRYSESLNEIAKNPYELNSELMMDTVRDFIELDNELNWFERNAFNNTNYHLTVNSQGFDEMLVVLKERKSQGLQDETDLKVIELLQKHSDSLFQHVRSEYNLFHHGYSSYFEILDIEGIGEPINKIEELAYFYNSYHKLPSEMKLMDKNELREKIKTVFNAKSGKVKLEKTLHNAPGVYRFEIKDGKTKIDGEINGYSGTVFTAFNNSQKTNDKKPMDQKAVMDKAKQLIRKVYGENANFEIWQENILNQPSVYRYRFVPLAGGYKLQFQVSDPYYIDYDAGTGEFNSLSTEVPMLTKEFFSKKYKEVLTPEAIETKATQVSGKKSKPIGKGIIYSNISSDYVLVHIFKGEENLVYINAETGVAERSYVSHYHY
ncbi:hypothetical protein [Fictibacillus halophilus]|uniref:hypothetical protein n=1 Tax=Fictibacillus halophilus TaxID=1610490 RepID=UPI001CF983F1|nr:hypothetical protein [Fictibacillus halophilus]